MAMSNLQRFGHQNNSRSDQGNDEVEGSFEVHCGAVDK